MAEIVSSVFSTAGYSLIACCIVFLLVKQSLVYRRLRQFKGPWLAATSKLWLMECTYKGTMHLDLADVCSKYGNQR